jgi:hypothetical protein
MTQSVYSATLPSYHVLPLRMIQWLMEVHMNEISDLTSLILSFHLKMIRWIEESSGLIRRLMGIWIVKLSSFLPHLACPSTQNVIQQL